MRTILALLAGAATFVGHGVQAAPTGQDPRLVAAYAKQMVTMCPTGPGGAPTQVAPDRVDLNADGRPDWVFDSSRSPCASANLMAKTYGSLVTIFLATPEGDAQPGFQRAAYGAHLERQAGKARLVLVLGGADCGGDKPESRCTKAVSWNAKEQRLELAPGQSSEQAASVSPHTPAIKAR